MMRLLVVLLSLVFSTNLYAAESIEHNGKQGIFIEDEAAKRLLLKVETELPALENQVILLQKQIDLQKQLLLISKEKFEAEQQITVVWKKNYETVIKQNAEYEEQDQFQHYVGAAIFVGGILTGAATVYLSSLVLENINR